MDVKFLSVQKDYRRIILGFLRSKVFMILLILTAALGYGFTLTNFSYGIDDLEFDRYFEGTDTLAQGRFSAYILHKVFGLYNFVPFWQDLLAVLVLLCAAIFWCAMIKKVAGEVTGVSSYLAFAAIMISFPAINELFIYMAVSFSIGLGFLLTGVSLAICYEVFFNRLKRLWLILSVILMCFTVSLYESFAAVYLCGLCMLLILRVLFADTEKKPIRQYAFIMLKFCCVLLCGIALRYAISYLILSVGHIPPGDYTAVQIQWGANGGFIGSLRYFLGGIYYMYLVHFSEYSYSAVTFVTCVLLLAAGIYLSKRNRDIKISLLFVAFIASAFSLAVVQGIVTPARATQPNYILTAFLAWILCAFAKKWRKPLVLFASACLVLFQTRDLSLWFFNDYTRYQQDKATAISIGTQIEKMGVSKPVVFTGKPKNYENVKVNGTNGISFFVWGIKAFGSDTELYKFFHAHGFELQRGDEAQRAEAVEKASDMPAWPEEGSIEECNDIIIVNFGNTDQINNPSP
jgi:hypothetical protein